MMYLRRKFDRFLEEWKSNPKRLPLIVRGARQVGKTASILHFAEAHYTHVAAVNFVESPAMREITADGYEPECILRLMSLLNPKFRLEPGKTLLFFDEVQAFPEITTALKFFAIDGRYDVICSGSLLGIQHARIESHSVGYKTDYELRSLDFEEFLWAMNCPEGTADDMLRHMLENRPFSSPEMKVYEAHFMDFVLLGGMPAVVRSYAETHLFSDTWKLQKQILADYREDIRKYAESLDKTKILAVFNQIPVQLAKENKKFQLSKISKNARSREYLGCVEWLQDAGVVTVCYCLNFPELPLMGNFNAAKYKLYMADTGLLIAMLDEEVRQNLRENRNLGIYKGALFENLVGEALSKSGYDLFYYRPDDATFEEDFFVRTVNWLIPVEVKSERGTSRSMRRLIASRHYPNICHGIKFAHANIGQTAEVTTFPYFCAFLLKRFLHSAKNFPPSSGTPAEA